MRQSETPLGAGDMKPLNALAFFFVYTLHVPSGVGVRLATAEGLINGFLHLQM